MRYGIVLIVCIFLFAQCRRADNQLPKSVENIRKFDTLGLPWLVYESDKIIYYFQDDSEINNINWVFLFANEHDVVYKAIDEVFNAQMPGKLHFFVWLDEAMAEKKLGGPLGWAIPAKCQCQTYRNQTLGHEMTHILSYWAGGVPPTTKTKFINEGVAVAFDYSGRDKIAMARKGLEGQNIQTVADIWAGNVQVSDDVIYPVGGAFMDFMYKQSTHDQFIALIKNQTIYDAYSIYGAGKMDSLIAQFDGMVGL